MPDTPADDLAARAFAPAPAAGHWEQFELGLRRDAEGSALAAARAVFAALVPVLDDRHAQRRLHGWFFMRKPPDVRLRLWLPDDGADVVAEVEARLWAPAAARHLRLQRRGRYRPETDRFGGPAAMDLAHAWFHVDSRLWWHLQAPMPAPADSGVRLLPAVLQDLFRRCCGERGHLAAWRELAALVRDAGRTGERRPAATATAAMLAEAPADTRERFALACWQDASRRLAAALPDALQAVAGGRTAAQVAATIGLFACNRHGLSGERSAPLVADMLAALGADDR